MLGFGPIASAPLAAVAGGDLIAGKISAGTPTFGAVSLAQLHEFSVVPFSIGATSVESITADQVHILSTSDLISQPTFGHVSTIQQQILVPLDVTVGAPSVATTQTSIIHSVTVNDIVSVPVIDGVEMRGAHAIVPRDIAPAPQVGPTPITQEHKLGGADISTRPIEIAVRFMWHLQPEVSDTWTVQPEADDIWTLQLENDTTWSNAA